MESTETPLEEIVIYSSVAKLEEKFSQVWNGRILEPFESLGWFIQLVGSSESILVGTDPPQFNVGDEVEIRIRKRI